MWCSMRTIFPTHLNNNGYNKKLNIMKINVGVIFGGRSVENEISVITAAQTMAAMNEEKYNIVPIYISKEGHWYTGE